MRRLFLFLLAAALLSTSAFAYTVASSTIAVTNTFQTALAASTSRRWCILQNQGTHVMYAYFGTLANATTAASLQVQAGQTITCELTTTAGGKTAITEDFNITGTSGDAFVVNSQ